MMVSINRRKNYFFEVGVQVIDNCPNTKHFEQMDFQYFQETAKDLMNSENFLSTGCDKIDKLLKGGISKRGITQIYGEAGSGKTQFALQLCLTAQIPKSNNSKSYALYICTESVFPSRRLEELLKTSPISNNYEASGDFIFVEHVSTVGDLEECILKKIPHLLSNGKQQVSLLIIDSIAAPYRVEYQGKDLKTRAKSLRTIGQALHDFSRSHGLCVVCINQVSAGMGSEIGLCSDLVPTLGITWASQVTNSIRLCKLGDERHLHIQESSYLSRRTLSFEITKSGVQGLGEI